MVKADQAMGCLESPPLGKNPFYGDKDFHQPLQQMPLPAFGNEAGAL
jgi:hypothetical protein